MKDDSKSKKSVKIILPDTNKKNQIVANHNLNTRDKAKPISIKNFKTEEFSLLTHSSTKSNQDYKSLIGITPSKKDITPDKIKNTLDLSDKKNSVLHKSHRKNPSNDDVNSSGVEDLSKILTSKEDEERKNNIELLKKISYHLIDHDTSTYKYKNKYSQKKLEEKKNRKYGKLINKNIKIIREVIDPLRKKLMLKKESFIKIAKQNTLTKNPLILGSKKLSIFDVLSYFTKTKSYVYSKINFSNPGGVVDLTLPSNQKKVLIKRFSKKVTNINPKMKVSLKDREKSARTIQGWWKDILSKYQNLVKSVILIQKVWKGHYIRINFEEISLFRILIQCLFEKIKMFSNPNKKFIFSRLKSRFAITYHNNMALIIQKNYHSWKSRKLVKLSKILSLILAMKSSRQLFSIKRLEIYSIEVNKKNIKIEKGFTLFANLFLYSVFNKFKRNIIRYIIVNYDKKLLTTLLQRSFRLNDLKNMKIIIILWRKISESILNNISKGLKIIKGVILKKNLIRISKISMKLKLFSSKINKFDLRNIYLTKTESLRLWFNNFVQIKKKESRNKMFGEKINLLLKYNKTKKLKKHLIKWVEFTTFLDRMFKKTQSVQNFDKTLKKLLFSNIIGKLKTFKINRIKKILSKRCFKLQFQNLENLKEFFRIWLNLVIKGKIQLFPNLMNGFQIIKRIIRNKIAKEFNIKLTKMKKFSKNLEKLSDIMNSIKKKSIKLLFEKMNLKKLKKNKTSYLLNILLRNYKFHKQNETLRTSKLALSKWKNIGSNLNRSERVNLNSMVCGIKNAHVRCNFNNFLKRLSKTLSKKNYQLNFKYKVLKNINQFYEKKLFHYFEKWKILINKAKIFKINLIYFSKIYNRIKLSLLNRKLKISFLKWNKQAKKITNMITDSIEILKRIMKKKAWNVILNRIKYKNKIVRIKDLIKIHSKMTLVSIKGIFNKWQKKHNFFKNKQNLFKILAKKLFGLKLNLIKSNKTSKLIKYLGKWKNFNETVYLNRLKTIQNLLKLVKHDNLKLNCLFFLKKLKKKFLTHKFKLFLKKNMEKIQDFNENKHKSILHVWFSNSIKNKIKSQVTLLKISKIRNLFNKLRFKYFNKYFQQFKSSKYDQLSFECFFNKIKIVYCKKILKIIKKKTNFSKIKIPLNKNKFQVYKSFGLNRTILFILKNRFMIKYFKIWRKYLRKLKNIDISKKLIRLRFQFIKKLENNQLMKRILKWKAQAKALKNKKELNMVKSMTCLKLSLKFKKKTLYSYYLRLKSIINRINEYENFSKNFIKKILRINFSHIVKKLAINRSLKIRIFESKKYSKLGILKILQKEDRKLLLKYFKSWNKIKLKFDLRDQFMKILFNIKHSQLSKLQKEFMFNCQLYLKYWRSKINPDLFYKCNKSILQASNFLAKSFRRRFYHSFILKMRKLWKMKKFKENIKKLTNVMTVKKIVELLSKKIKIWKVRLNDKFVFRKRLQIIFEDYFERLNKNRRNSSILKDKLIDILKICYKRNNQFRSKIFVMIKSKLLRKKIQKMKNKKESTFRLFSKFSNTLEKQLQSKFYLWKNKFLINKIQNSCLKIQKFWKKRKTTKFNYLTKIMTLNGIFRKLSLSFFLKKLKKINEKKKLQSFVNKYRRNLTFEEKFPFLIKFFRNWREITLKLKTDEAGTKINNKFRSKRALNKKQQLLEKDKRSKDLFVEFSEKLNAKSSYYLIRWKKIALLTKYNFMVRRIQRNYILLKKIKSKNKVRRMLRFYLIHQIYNIFKKIFDKPKGREESFCLLFERLIKSRMNLFQKRIKFLNFSKILNILLPKENTKNLKFWMRHTLLRWKNFMVLDKQKKMKTIFNFIRTRNSFKNFKRQSKLNRFLKSKINNLLNYKQILKKKYFLKWLKFSQSAKVHSNIILIQKSLRTHNSKKKLIFLKAQKKWKQLLQHFEKTIQKKVLKSFVKFIHLRRLFNKATKILENKQKVSIFRLVNYFSERIDMKIALIQNRFRIMKSKNKLSKLREIKCKIQELLNSKLINLSRSLDSYFQKLKFLVMKSELETNSKILQNFIRKRVLYHSAKKTRKFISDCFSNYKVNLSSSIIKCLKWGYFVKILSKSLFYNHSKLATLVLKKVKNKSNYKDFKLKIKSILYGLNLKEYLLFYIRIWKENNKYVKKFIIPAVHRIQSSFRKLKLKIERKNRFISKILTICNSIDNQYSQKIRALLIFWKNYSRLKLMNENVKIIQKFITKNLNRIKEKREKPLKLKKLSCIKFNTIFDLLSKKKAIFKIQEEVKKRILLKFLLCLKNFKIHHISHFIKNMKKYSNLKKQKFKNFVIKMQNLCRMKFSKSKAQKLSKINYFLNKIINRKLNKVSKLFVKSLSQWNRQIIIQENVSAIRVIHKFCLKVHSKKDKNRMISLSNLKEIFRGFFILKILKLELKNFISSVKLTRLMMKVEKLVYFISFYKIKTIFKLKKIECLVKRIIFNNENLMKNKFQRLKTVTYRLKSMSSALFIQKWFRNKKLKLKNNLKFLFLKNKFTEISEKIENRLKYYLNLWRKKYEFQIIKEASTKIKKFMLDKFKARKIHAKLIEIIQKYKSMFLFQEKMLKKDFIRKIKFSFKMTKFIENLRKRIGKLTFLFIRRQALYSKIFKLILEIESQKTLKNSLIRWQKLKSSVKITESFLNSINTYIRTVINCRTFKRLFIYSQYINNLQTKKDCLKKIDDQIKISDYNQVTNHLYKIYAYKVISHFLQIFDGGRNYQIKLLNSLKNAFFSSLKDLNKKNLNFSYKEKESKLQISNSIILKKYEVKNNTKIASEITKNINRRQILKILTYFHQYLIDIYDKRRIKCFKTLIKVMNYKKFIILFKNKLEIFQKLNLKDSYQMLMARFIFLKKVFDKLKKFRNKIKKIPTDISMKFLFKLWKIYVKKRKFKKRKMTRLYKNPKIQYLNLSGDLLNDSSFSLKIDSELDYYSDQDKSKIDASIALRNIKAGINNLKESPKYEFTKLSLSNTSKKTHKQIVSALRTSSCRSKDKKVNFLIT